MAGKCSGKEIFLSFSFPFQKVKVKVAQLCPILCNPMDCTVHGILQARTLEWVAVPFSRGSSQPRDRTQVSPFCRWILDQLSHQGSLRIRERVAYPFPRGSFWPRNWTRVSCIVDGFFTREASIPEGDLNTQVIIYMTWEKLISNSSWITSFFQAYKRKGKYNHHSFSYSCMCKSWERACVCSWTPTHTTHKVVTGPITTQP